MGTESSGDITTLMFTCHSSSEQLCSEDSRIFFFRVGQRPEFIVLDVGSTSGDNYFLGGFLKKNLSKTVSVSFYFLHFLLIND